MENYYFKHSTHFGDMFGLFEEFYRTKLMTDVMITCDGRTINAHRMVLSAGSEYFRRILAAIKNNNQFPVLFINDIAYEDMETIVEFIYRGQIVVTRDKVESLRQAAYKLRIKGFENFLRKPFHANGTGSNSSGIPITTSNNNFRMSTGTMRNISMLNSESKRIVPMLDNSEHTKKQKVNGHSGNNSFDNPRMNSKDLLIFNRYKEEMKRLSNGNSPLENGLLVRANHHSTPNGLPKKILMENILKRTALDLRQESSRNENEPKSLLNNNNNNNSHNNNNNNNGKNTDSDSVTITPINGDAHDSNGSLNVVESGDENEDNHKNENAENCANENVKENGGVGGGKVNGQDGSPNKSENNDCDSDDAHEVKYTYELDPNVLNWDSYNDENMPDNLEESEDYEDEDYFENVNRNSMEMMLNQANMMNKMNGTSNNFFYCEHCPKYFFDEDHLQLHIKRTHGLNKLNLCNICGKSYAWKSGLYKHKRAVHGIGGKPPLSNKLTQLNDNVMMDQSQVVEMLAKQAVSNGFYREKEAQSQQQLQQQQQQQLLQQQPQYIHSAASTSPSSQ